MRLGSAGSPHLTYCTNIHAGESWAEIRGNVERFVPAVRRGLPGVTRFGVGLRLSGRAAEELSEERELARFRAWLDEQGLYVFTINGFPYGAFHGTRVKEAVYLPDWLDDERVAYSDRLARLLAALLPDDSGLEGTVSTVPGAFKPRVTSEQAVREMAARMLRHAASLVRIADQTGKIVSLALEPEPFCHLETVGETVAFFEAQLFSTAAVAAFAELAGLAGGRAEEALRRHLGVCFDACHMAVEFEPAVGALDAFAAAGIRIGKIQISAGLEVPSDLPLDETIAALRPFAEDVYLHQVTERAPTSLARYLDLPDALAAAERRGDRAGAWRVHFHVPLFRERLGPFASTQRYLVELLERVRAHRATDHLEVETYTWDVLPEEYRRESIVEAIARELSWVRGQLEPQRGGTP